MNYEQLKPKIGQVAVFWTRSNALFSRLIRLFTQSSVSHTGFIFKDHGRVMVWECLEGKDCIIIPASNRFKDQEVIIANVNVPDKQAFIESLYQDVGKVKYNLFGALVSLFWRTKSSEKFCSEAVAEKLGLQFSHLNRGITPSDVLSALQDKVI